MRGYAWSASDTGRLHARMPHTRHRLISFPPIAPSHIIRRCHMTLRQRDARLGQYAILLAMRHTESYRASRFSRQFRHTSPCRRARVLASVSGRQREKAGFSMGWPGAGLRADDMSRTSALARARAALAARRRLPQRRRQRAGCAHTLHTLLPQRAMTCASADYRK